MLLQSSAGVPESMRSGQARPIAIGTRMSGVPSWASTDWSRQTTIEWMMLCGWMTTLICSGARPNR